MIVATAVMVHLVAPEAEAEADSAVDPVDLVAPVERAVVPAVDPELVARRGDTGVVEALVGEVWPDVARRAVAFATKDLQPRLLLFRERTAVAVDEPVV